MEFYNDEISKLISSIRRSEGKDIFIDGGAELVFELMKNNLIDRFVISVIPVFLGNGIPLFKHDREEQNLKLVDCKTFESGLVQMCYDAKK